jgi:hypothetical protein
VLANFFRESQIGHTVCSGEFGRDQGSFARDLGVFADARLVTAAHQFPTMAMIHLLELPAPPQFAPVVACDQYGSRGQPKQTHGNSCPRFVHGTLPE